MFFQTVFVSLALLGLGVALCVLGFRLFVVLLPLYAFFAGFTVTAQSIQQLFGGGFLATIGSWVFAILAGVFCAVIAYLFYYAAIVILAASVGYELGVGFLVGISVSSGLLQFIVGAVIALAFAAGVVFFNLPRLLIIVLSAIAGAALILTGIFVAVGRIPLDSLKFGIYGGFIHLSWFWGLVFLLLAAAGIVAQLMTPAQYSLHAYDEEEFARRTTPPESMMTEPPAPSSGAGPEGVPAT